MSNEKRSAEIQSELWKQFFIASPQPALITTLDDRVVAINDSARDLLNFHGDIENHKVDCLLARLKPSLREMVRVQRAESSLQDNLMVYLQDVRETFYSERLLTFYATTLKSLDTPASLTRCCESVMTEAATIAVKSLADWCRVDLREDLDIGKGVAVHADLSLAPFLVELQKIENNSPDDLLNPLRVIRSGTTIFKEDVSDELLRILSVAPRAFALFTKVGLRSYICIPIKKDVDTVGCVTFARSSESAPFDAVDLMMAEEFAAKVSVNLERALLYKNLAHMKDAAESANRAKTNFLANVSHEIRTPLGAIVGFSELLSNANSSPEDRQDWSAKIRDNSSHLLRIIDDILDISKVEAGKIDLEIKELDLKHLLREIRTFAEGRIVGKEVEFQLVIKGALPRYVRSDITRLMQVLSNVVGNAIKFTTKGYVRLTVEKPKTQDLISFEVSDTGIGISSSQSGLLFQPFTQADASHTRQFGGTGLGLALSRTLARSLGGDLVLAESEVGNGSTFLISVDCRVKNNAEMFTGIEIEKWEVVNSSDIADRDVVEALRGRRVLLVEDSTDIQALIKRFLEGAGAHVFLASNGEEGVEAARTSDYDVILMDVQMPIKDGCQAAQELRAWGYTGLIVALTANAMKEEKDRCLASGYDAHLSKPIRRADLIRQISQYIVNHESMAKAGL